MFVFAETHIRPRLNDREESRDQGGPFGVVGRWKEGSVAEGEESGEERWDIEFSVWA